MFERLVGALVLVMTVPAHGFGADHAAAAFEHFRAASKSFVEKRYDAAIADLRKSLELDPGQLKAVRLLGLTYQLVGQMEKAEAQFTEACELAPRDSESWFYLGRVQYIRNFFDKALASLRTAAKYAPDDWRVRECLGLTLEAAGDTGSAELEYQQAVRSSPSRTGTPYMNFGAFLLKLGRPAESEKMLERAATLMPESWQVHFELAKVYQQTDRFEAALKELSTSLNCTPSAQEVARTQALMATVYARLGRETEARVAAAAAEK